MRRALLVLALALLPAGCAQKAAVEYVTVAFPDAREVFIDGNANGSTNKVLYVEPGTHRFDLGPKKDYAPDFHQVMVKDTTVLKPLALEFRRKGS